MKAAPSEPDSLIHPNPAFLPSIPTCIVDAGPEVDATLAAALAMPAELSEEGGEELLAGVDESDPLAVAHAVAVKVWLVVVVEAELPSEALAVLA